jgi:hypothetical protein
MGRGSGFGKTILIGDQFVLYQVPAIVAALSFETIAEVEQGGGGGGGLTGRDDSIILNPRLGQQPPHMV